MVTAVAGGEADFALTSVAYLLAGQTFAQGRLAARFAAVFHQRNPLAALVASDSRMHSHDDLAGSRVAATDSWYLQELDAGLRHLGLPPASRVDAPSDMLAALRDGQVDLIPGWVDMSPTYSREGLEIRAIPLEVDAYATGLVAADRLAPELVTRMRDALIAGYHLQREQPELGIDALRRSVPAISTEHLSTAWSLFEPLAFAGPEPLAMDAERWTRTIDYTAATHGLPCLPAEQVYRQELLTPATTLAPV
jgi:ABC-type nitrate/sulfonate/bicarbonate transport system substrate-binding protein